MRKVRRGCEPAEERSNRWSCWCRRREHAAKAPARRRAWCKEGVDVVRRTCRSEIMVSKTVPSSSSSANPLKMSKKSKKLLRRLCRCGYKQRSLRRGSLSCPYLQKYLMRFIFAFFSVGSCVQGQWRIPLWFQAASAASLNISQGARGHGGVGRGVERKGGKGEGRTRRIRDTTTMPAWQQIPARPYNILEQDPAPPVSCRGLTSLNGGKKRTSPVCSGEPRGGAGASWRCCMGVAEVAGGSRGR
jgi:hypothetical protein